MLETYINGDEFVLHAFSYVRIDIKFLSSFYLLVMRVADELGCNPYLAGCLAASSYVTLIFYTRTFTNSLESFFFAILLVAVMEYVSLCRKAKLAKALQKNNENNDSGIQNGQDDDATRKTDTSANSSQSQAHSSMENYVDAPFADVVKENSEQLENGIDSLLSSKGESLLGSGILCVINAF